MLVKEGKEKRIDLGASSNLCSHGFPAVLRFIDACQPSQATPSVHPTASPACRETKGTGRALLLPSQHPFCISPRPPLLATLTYTLLTTKTQNGMRAATPAGSSTAWPKWGFRTGESAILLLAGTCQWSLREARKGHTAAAWTLHRSRFVLSLDGCQCSLYRTLGLGCSTERKGRMS